MTKLVSCGGCRRHVFADAARCPFCGRRSGTAAAGLPRWAAALVAWPLVAGVACDSSDGKPDGTKSTPKDGGDKAKADGAGHDDAAAKADDAAAAADDAAAAGEDAGKDDDAAKADGADAHADGADAADGGSQPPDDGASVTPPIKEPISKPKYGVARPRPPKKYGAPPRPKPDDKDPFG